MSSQHDIDRELEEFLNQSRPPIVDLYRKLPQPQPDAQLDQQILKLARQALVDDATPASVTAKSPARRKAARWPIALGSAASVVFAAGLALYFGTENWQTQSHAPAGAVLSSASDVVQVRSIDSPDAKSGGSDAIPLPAPALKPAPASETALSSNIAARKKSIAASLPVAPIQSAPKLESTANIENDAATKNAPPRLETAEVAGTNVGRIDAESAARAPEAAFPRDTAAVDKNKASPASSADAKIRDDRDAVERKLDIATGRDAAIRARNVEAAKPQAATSMSEPAAAARAAAPAAKAVEKPSSAAANAAGAVANPTPPAAAAGAVTNPTADVWIAKIRAQLQAGQHDEAVRNLKQFREKYPSYELAPDLRQLLP